MENHIKYFDMEDNTERRYNVYVHFDFDDFDADLMDDLRD